MMFFVSISLLKQDSEVIQTADELLWRGNTAQGTHPYWFQTSGTTNMGGISEENNKLVLHPSTRPDRSLGTLIATAQWEPMRFYD
jgi:hypothetical protein